MKLGVSIYSFHKYASDKDKGVRSCIEKAVEMGFSGLDFIEVGLMYQDYLSYAKGIREFCRHLEIEPVCFCTAADFLVCDDIKAETERVKRNVDIAAAYGCSILRHDISRGFPKGDCRSYRQAVEIVAPAVREITLYARELGIRTTTENHGFFSQDSQRVELLINAVGEKNFGALVDVGNFSCVDEDNVLATARLAPYAFHSHVKDFYIREGSGEDHNGWICTRGGKYLQGAVFGMGDIRAAECINALKSGGYDGYLTLEYEGADDPIEGILSGYDRLKEYSD